MFDNFPVFEFLSRFFRRDEPKSGASARNRLQLVLIQDRANVCPELLESLRNDLIALISKYMVIDEEAMSVELERKEGTVALAACIPVLNIRRNQPAIEESVAAVDPPEEPKQKLVEATVSCEEEPGHHGAD